jgi:peptidoglycan hydrolase-like protein with peptidoglycan-binding domain
MTLRIAALALFGALAVAPAAAAQQPPLPTPTPTPTPSPTPAPAAPPPPAKGKVALKAERTLRDGKRKVEVTGGAWRVRGIVRPFVAGQTVRVRFTLGGKAVKTRRVPLRPGPAGTGTFLVAFTGRRPGRVAVVASHRGTPQLERLRSRALRLRILDPQAAPGARGAVVRLLQHGLRRLHYAVPLSGVLDAGTQRAVLAWRKVAGQPRTFAASPSVVRGVLAGRGTFRVRHPDAGHHVEADLSRQVLALIDGDKVRRIYHTSSGKPSTPTVRGKFRIYRKQLGTNSHGMVDASYFIGGYAIHGYVEVPAFNASHGCLRIPIPDAASVQRWLHFGDTVWVYS